MMKKIGNNLNEESIKKEWNNPVMEKLEIFKTTAVWPVTKGPGSEHNDSATMCHGPGNISNCT